VAPVGAAPFDEVRASSTEIADLVAWNR
jgi:hypothetical protein